VTRTTDQPEARRSRAARLLPVAALALLPLASCEEVETRTVESVKAEYAQRFVDGLEFGQAGRIKASSFDPQSFILKDVQVDDGPDRLYHADLAEMHVSPDADTLVLEFMGVTGADPTHGMTQTPVATTPPVALPFDVIP
jgi:hypothetical protein